MDRRILVRLESLNQLSLTESEREEMLSYFEKQDGERAILETVDTEKVERMVHVYPLENVLREDVAKKLFSRDDLQKNAPEANDGYWQVPRLVE